MGTATNNCAAAVEPRLAVIDTETNFENEVMSSHTHKLTKSSTKGITSSRRNIRRPQCLAARC